MMLGKLKKYLVVLLVASAVIGLSVYVYKGAYDGIGSSPSAVAAIEKQRGLGYVSYMIHEHAIPDGEIAFFIRNMPNDRINIGAEYVRKTSKGWNLGWGGSFGASNIRLGLSDVEAGQETFHAEYFSSTEGSEYGSSPFPMFFGVILNPDISRMTVKDYVTGMVKQAEIIEVERNLKLFYVLVDKTQGTKFDITGYAADGSVKHKKTTDESLPFQASTTKIE
jgi:hypothetical protein